MQQLARLKKGQIAVIDLFIAAMVFSLVVTAIMLTWNSYNVKINNQISYNEIVIKGFHISDLLAKYPGKPTYWDKFGDVSIIGLVNGDRVINPNKLNNFTNMAYDEIRDKFNIMNYQFYFNLSDAYGDNFESISIGNKIVENRTINIRRYVIFNDQEAVMEFAVWEG